MADHNVGKLGRIMSAAVILLVADAALANPVGDIAGRWSGWGSISMDGGGSEQVRCVVTYAVKDAGAGLHQNMRCASASLKIDATARLTFASGQVAGSWEESTTSTSGSVSGRITPEGFNLSIHGATFTAAMAVVTSGCKQSINIAPQGLEVSRISIGLGKCSTSACRGMPAPPRPQSRGSILSLLRAAANLERSCRDASGTATKSSGGWPGRALASARQAKAGSDHRAGFSLPSVSDDCVAV